MVFLGYSKDELQKNGGVHTAQEISHQPDLWREIWLGIEIDRSEIKEFINRAVKDVDTIILTGAGTSSFVGLSAQGYFQNRLGKITQSISTTHIVSHPKDYLNKKNKVLLVSFARSGNSPESKAAVKLADHFSAVCYHLIITCNPEGELAKLTKDTKKYVYVLPEKANDQSLAMTSSFSGMLLASLLIANIDKIEKAKAIVENLSKNVERIIDQQNDFLQSIAEHDFKRAVFLGSGPFYGIATESQLKMQELTDGIVVGKHDSFLGLRHGPKAVIDSQTLVFYHFSNNAYAQKYEWDLVKSIDSVSQPLGQLGVMGLPVKDDSLDWKIIFDSIGSEVEEEYLAVASIVPAQILAFHKSLNLGLSPDNPSRNGAISRVVQGVNIYEI